MSALAAPRTVSPFIRFCRYAMLASGFVYGTYRLKYLQRKEGKVQEYEGKIKEQRALRLGAEQERKIKEEMDSLGREAGILGK